MKARVLVVEDEPQVSRVLSFCLRQSGHELLNAGTGEEAICLALKDHPDVIVMDLGLPGMSGLEATAVIKQNKQMSRIPIIALSGRPPELWRERALQAGISLYLSKPASLDEIMRAIEQVVLAQSSTAETGAGNLPQTAVPAPKAPKRQC
jgi:two-component system KDP operon response regulator KdpE